MTRDEVERLAEGVVRLRAAIIRERNRAGEERPALSSTQALALRAVVREGPLRVGALAEELGVSVATASRTAESLVGLGLVRREQDASDARARLLAATEAGRAAHRVRRARFVQALDDVLASLPPQERAQLAASLATLEQLLAPAAAGGAGVPGG